MQKTSMKTTGTALLLSALLAVSATLSACTAAPASSDPSPTAQPSSQEESAESGKVTFTDDLDREVTLESWDMVVSLYGSFAETWELAGGELAGVTEDAVEERHMDLGEGVETIGSVKSPNLEAILALDPDFVILSADVATQVDLEPALQESGVPYAYFQVDTFDQYLSMLELFCSMTGRDDLYEQNGLRVQQQIADITALTKKEEPVTGLLIRAFSTGAKAKGADNLAGVIMEDLGVDNIVARHDSLLEDLSIEEIIEEDPDYIFVTTMGKESAALEALESGIMANPAWEGLTAVKNDRVEVLPKDLFHYKPNARWGESYAYLAKILYPGLTEEIDDILAQE